MLTRVWIEAIGTEVWILRQIPVSSLPSSVGTEREWYVIGPCVIESVKIGPVGAKHLYGVHRLGHYRYDVTEDNIFITHSDAAQTAEARNLTLRNTVLEKCPLATTSEKFKAALTEKLFELVEWCIRSRK